MNGVVIKYKRDNIDTDAIIPGTYLEKIHDYAELATHAMEGLDTDFHSKIKSGGLSLLERILESVALAEFLHVPIASGCKLWHNLADLYFYSFPGDYFLRCYAVCRFWQFDVISLVFYAVS